MHDNEMLTKPTWKNIAEADRAEHTALRTKCPVAVRASQSCIKTYPVYLFPETVKEIL